MRKYDNVLFIDEDNLLLGLSKRAIEEYILLNNSHLFSKKGWYLQQFLKMGFAMSEYSEDYYLIWDADTLPVRKIDFFHDNKVLFCLKDEYHIPYFDTLKKIIGQSKAISQSFIAEHMMI